VRTLQEWEVVLAGGSASGGYVNSGGQRPGMGPRRFTT